MADLSKLVEIVLQLNDQGVVDQLIKVVSSMGTLENKSEDVDKSIDKLNKSLRGISKTTLPALRKAFDQTVKSQDKFIKQEEKKIAVLKRLAAQAKTTGDSVKKNLNFTSANLTAGLKASIAGLASALPALLGGAIGSALGGRGGGITSTKIDVDTEGLKQGAKDADTLDKSLKDAAKSAKKVTDELLDVGIAAELSNIAGKKFADALDGIKNDADQAGESVEGLTEELVKADAAVKKLGIRRDQGFVFIPDEADIRAALDRIRAGVKKTVFDIRFAFELLKEKIVNIFNKLPRIITGPIKLAAAAIVKSLRAAGRAAKKIGSSFKNVFSGILKQVLSLKGAIIGFVTVGLGARLAKGFVDTGARVESLRLRLGLLFKSLDDGAASFKLIQDLSLRTGKSVEELGNSTAALTGAIGKGPVEIQKILEGAVDIAAISGLSVQTTTEQIIKLWTSGLGAAEQFKEKGILEMLGFTAGASVPLNELRERLDGLFEEGSFKGAAEELAQTWDGLMGQLIAGWEAFKTTVLDAGVFEFIKAAFGVLLDNFKSLKDDPKEFAEAMNEMAEQIIDALSGVIKGIGFIVDGINGLRFIAQVLKGVYAKVAEVIVSIFETVRDAIGTALIFVFSKLRALAEGLERIGDLIGIVFQQDVTGGSSSIVASLAAMELSLAKAAGNTQDLSGFWTDVADEAFKAADEIDRIPSAVDAANKFLEDTKQKMKENAAAQKVLNERLAKQKQLQDANKQKKKDDFAAAGASGGTGGERDLLVEGLGTGSTALAAQLSILRNQLKTQQTIFQQSFAEGQASLQVHFDRRQEISKAAIAKEIELLQAQADQEKEVAKRAGLLDQIVQLRRTASAQSVAIEQERINATRELLDQEQAMLSVDGERVLELNELLRDQLATQRDIRLAQAQSDRDMEITSAEEHQARILAITAAHEQKLRNERQKTLDMWLQSTKSTASSLEEAFTNLYEATGSKVKEFFYLAKAAAIVQTIISTYEGAQKTYTALSGIPYVGPFLGAAAAAVVVAGGLARIATIRSQNLAEGGEVAGYSPSPTSDNISANLTAGEYVMPVSAVKHYGLPAMEAMRSKAMSRAGMANSNNLPSASRHKFAHGGQVAGAQQNAAAARSNQDVPAAAAEQPINITNVVDPAVFDSYVNSRAGERNIINVVQRNARAFKAALND